MSILFGFCDTQLVHTKGRNIFSQGVFQTVRREGYFHIWHFRIVLGHADVFQVLWCFLTFKSIKVCIYKGTGNFTCTVRTEVEHDDRISVMDETICCIAAYGRENELVGFTALICCFYCFHAVYSLMAFAKGQRIIRLHHTFPALVTVHSIITSGNYAHMADTFCCQIVFQLGHVVDTGTWRYIAAVHEAVDEKIFDAALLSQLYQCLQVGEMAVHAAVRQEPVQVECSAGFQYMVTCTVQRNIIEEDAVLDCLGDFGQFLIYDAAGTDV